MTGYSLNFDGVEPAGDFTPLEEGPYTFKIDSAKIEDSKDPAKARSLKLVLIAEDYPDKKVWHNLYLGQQSAPWVLQFLIGVFGKGNIPGGINPEDDEWALQFCKDLTGESVLAVVEIDGKYNKITSFEEAPF